MNTSADDSAKRWRAAANPRAKQREGRCVHFNRDPAGVGECTPTSDEQRGPLRLPLAVDVLDES